MRSKFMRVLICHFPFLSSLVRRRGGEKGTTLRGQGPPLPGTCGEPLVTALPLSPSPPDEDEFLRVLESGFWSCDMSWEMGKSLLVQLQ